MKYLKETSAEASALKITVCIGSLLLFWVTHETDTNCLTVLKNHFDGAEKTLF